MFQKLMKKESIVVSFGAIMDFGHHAVSFMQVRDAVCILLVFELVTLRNSPTIVNKFANYVY